MKSIGSTLLFFGVGTIVLNLIGYEFAILAWIEMWGETVGWAIRAAMIVAGAILFFLGWRGEQGAAEAAAPAARQEPTMQSQSSDPLAQPATPDPMMQEPASEPTMPDPAADPLQSPERS